MFPRVLFTEYFWLGLTTREICGKFGRSQWRSRHWDSWKVDGGQTLLPPPTQLVRGRGKQLPGLQLQVPWVLLCLLQITARWNVNLQQDYHFCGLSTAARWQAWSQGSRDQYGYQRLINVDSSYLCSSPVHFYLFFHWAWPMHDLRFSTTDRRKSQARPTSSHKWVWSNCCNKTLLYNMAASSAFLSEPW